MSESAITIHINADVGASDVRDAILRYNRHSRIDARARSAHADIHEMALSAIARIDAMTMNLCDTCSDSGACCREFHPGSPGASDAACADAFPLYAEGDKCPECGELLLYDAGEPMTREHPGSSPCIFCDECGSEYPVDYDRMEAPNDAIHGPRSGQWRVRHD